MCTFAVVDVLTEKKTRDKAVKAVAAFLADDAAVAAYSKAEMDKLWKALFYCQSAITRAVSVCLTLAGVATGYWMSDKPLVQQALATELAELVLSIDAIDDALRFLRSFWDTTVREWSGLDRLRCATTASSEERSLKGRIAQDGQVLHACETIRQRWLPPSRTREVGRALLHEV